MLLSINPTLHIQAKYVQTFLFLPRHSPQQHHCSLRSLTDLNFFQQQPPRKIDKALQKSEAELSMGITTYLELRLFFLRPGFPFVDDFPPEGPEVLFRIFLKAHATGSDGNLRGLGRPPRMPTLAG